MASLDDILTTQKNGVIALNNLFSAISFPNPAFTSATVTAPTLILTGAGRLLSFAVVVAGSGTGTIHNAGALAGNTAANALVATPATIGVYPVSMIFSNGLLIVPGTGQSINVTYSRG